MEVVRAKLQVSDDCRNLLSAKQSLYCSLLCYRNLWSMGVELSLPLSFSAIGIVECETVFELRLSLLCYRNLWSTGVELSLPLSFLCYGVTPHLENRLADSFSFFLDRIKFFFPHLNSTCLNRLCTCQCHVLPCCADSAMLEVSMRAEYASARADRVVNKVADDALRATEDANALRAVVRGRMDSVEPAATPEQRADIATKLLAALSNGVNSTTSSNNNSNSSVDLLRLLRARTRLVDANLVLQKKIVLLWLHTARMSGPVSEWSE